MYTLNCNGRLIVVDKPLVMGIINITPDSFYEASRVDSVDAVLCKAEQMIKEGADILDIGGQSTRPGSEQIKPDEELRRAIPAIEAILKSFPGTVISIDTFHASVAREAGAAGALMVNDISAGNFDPEMMRTVAAMNIPYICMHMKGEPARMQENPHYENVTAEVLDFLVGKVTACVEAGIKDIIVDPGFGFGKNIRHNFTLLRELSTFRILEKPIMVGLSRKSTIYKTLGISADEALNGSTVLHTIALMNGANILRVHDVKEAREAAILYQFYMDAG